MKKLATTDETSYTLIVKYTYNHHRGKFSAVTEISVSKSYRRDHFGTEEEIRKEFISANKWYNICSLNMRIFKIWRKVSSFCRENLLQQSNFCWRRFVKSFAAKKSETFQKSLLFSRICTFKLISFSLNWYLILKFIFMIAL